MHVHCENIALHLPYLILSTAPKVVQNSVWILNRCATPSYCVNPQSACACVSVYPNDEGTACRQAGNIMNACGACTLACSMKLADQNANIVGWSCMLPYVCWSRSATPYKE